MIPCSMFFCFPLPFVFAAPSLLTPQLLNPFSLRTLWVIHPHLTVLPFSLPAAVFVAILIRCFTLFYLLLDGFTNRKTEV